MATSFPDGFIWGASTAAHQTEGNNVNSDMWASEGMFPGMERSGDACDSYHRWREDMQLLADSGLTAYRFSVEWARIEPVEGEFSLAELGHYRRMIEHAIGLGLTPVVTLHHFTVPRWFSERGGWFTEDAVSLFERYVERTAAILDGVEWVVTINEPNMLAMMVGMARAFAQAQQGGEQQEWQSPTVDGDHADDQASRPQVLPAPDPEIGAILVRAHEAARTVLRARTKAKIGWSVANGALVARPGSEARLLEEQRVREDLYLEPSKDDDFVGVQSYSSQWVGPDGVEPHPPHPDNTLVNTAYRPDALGIAVRHVAAVTGDTPILVTENGIATDDDARRIAYTMEALGHLAEAIKDGADVRGYLHWSLLDNFEWGHWEPTFGLVAVDRETFARTPKPSLAWLGSVAQNGGIDS
ncbi:family 1 glycosylhydrolase [Demequina zhanjiangensis]|uniref:Family 1 glycosylhydrolase n=1 Tax=Demequina zhanjiangensis TaxID=3051659 RepID=A0ABT8G4W8_9MICO|nr:family 1 glycosylhydrolase [Demequina sp. SYSU T00b26]MDN4474186.1 family 1 glycosylhydrolase [Demequina sp. SYSU T00b26]